MQCETATGTPESNRAIIDMTRNSQTPAHMDTNGDDQKQLSINTKSGAKWVHIGDQVIEVSKGVFDVIRWSCRRLDSWIEEYIQDTRQLLGIGDDWQIVVKMVDAPADDASRDGHIELNARYRSAKIYLNEALDKEQLKHTTMHELLHIAFAPVSLNHLRMIELLPEGLRSHAEELFADGIEQSIEALTRALQRAIQPKEQD